MESSDSQYENHVLSSNSFKGSETNGNESVYYEKFLLDDLDNYWDELNDRLTVTRMVNDSVIKGIVNALIAESKESITLKEVEIETLNKKLNSLHNISPLKHSTIEEKLKCNSVDNICRVRLDVEDHIQKLKENIHNADMGVSGILSKQMRNKNLIEAYKSVNSLDTAINTLFKEIDEIQEIRLQDRLEREINSIILGSSVENFQNKFEKKLYEQISINKRLNMDREQKANELSGIRDHLNSLSSILSSTESKLLLSHNSLDNLDSFEEWNTPKRKELVSRKVSGSHHKEENGITSKNIKLDVPDASQLKHLSRDELIEYYKNEMIGMRRQHESALQEKTEEIFKLKREILRQKGSSPFKRDHEILRKTIPEIILKLDDVILEKKMISILQVDDEEVCNLRNNIDKLQSENKHLKSIIADKNKLNGGLSSHDSDGASQILLHSSLETNLLQQMKKIKKSVEETEMESCIRDMVHRIVIKEVISESKCVVDDLEAETRIMLDVMNIVVDGYTHDVMSTIKSIIISNCTEKSYLEALVCDEENTLCMEIEKNKKLEEKIAYLSTLTEDEEKHASQLEQLNQLIKEIEILKEQVAKQEVLILNKEAEKDLLNNKINEALQQLHQYDSNFIKLNEELTNVVNALDEAEKQKSLLHGIIEDHQKKLSSSIANEKQLARQSEFVVNSIAVLLEASANFEHKVVENIHINESRLKSLHGQCRTLAQQATVFPNKAMLYKQMYDIKSSNLQKAEAEVDLLGDEVDTLWTLLGKIYIALDHYSPVLKHYPGVMETLKLIRRELGEPEASVNEKSERPKRATKSVSKFR